MIVSFVDIGGIVDHHCLNFLFIIILDLPFFPEQILKVWNPFPSKYPPRILTSVVLLTVDTEENGGKHIYRI